MNVFIVAAVTADGFIARSPDHLSMEWTSAEDKRHFVQLTKEAGAVVVGSRTFATFGRVLRGRRTIVLTRNPDSITADDVEATAEQPAELLKRLESEGVRSIAICGGAHVYTAFMQAGLVDELYLNLHSAIFGTGVPLFSAPVAAQITLQGIEQFGGQSILLRYNVAK